MIDNIATVEDYEKGEDLALLKQKYAEGVKGGDTNRILVWAGSGVGLMNQVKPAWVCLNDLFFLIDLMSIFSRTFWLNFMKDVYNV